MFLYNILGVDSIATKEQIKAAYRAKAKKFHPDLNDELGFDILFIAIKKAYEILIDDYQRNNYDKSVSSGVININSELKIQIINRIKDAYKSDLVLSIDAEKELDFNQQLAKVELIYNFSVVRNFSVKLILNIVEEYLNKISMIHIKEIETIKYVKIDMPDKSGAEINEDGLDLNTKQKLKFSLNLQSINIFIFIVLVLTNLFNFYNKDFLFKTYGSTQDSEEVTKEIELNEVLPSWTLKIGNINSGLGYLVENAKSLKDGRTIINDYCVLVEIIANKSLDDYGRIDNQLEIQLATSNFTFGGRTPYQGYGLLQCSNVFGEYALVNDKSFILKDSVSTFLLFNINKNDYAKDPKFRYKNSVIEEMNIKNIK